MSVTIRQVAEAAGVSISTVSQVLRGNHASYLPETRARVLAAAEQVGYRPNASARFMQTGRFHIIGLLHAIDHPSGSLPMAIIDGAAAVFEQHGYHLLLIRLERQRLVSGPPPAALAERMTDGFLVTLHLDVLPAEEEAIARLGQPAVWLNRKLATDAAHPDDLAAGRRCAEELLAAGHRRIAIADINYGAHPERHHYSPVDRRAGAIAALRAAGVSPTEWVTEEWLEYAERQAWARALLSATDRPSAVITVNNATAGALLATAQELGIRVPQDLSLITINGEPFTTAGLPMATVLVPQTTLGHDAAELLLARMASEVALPSVAVPPGWFPGLSIAAPRS